jgi:hypothetical protein
MKFQRHQLVRSTSLPRAAPSVRFNASRRATLGTESLQQLNLAWKANTLEIIVLEYGLPGGQTQGLAGIAGGESFLHRIDQRGNVKKINQHTVLLVLDEFRNGRRI